MLRRNFIKATALSVGGFLIIRKIPFADEPAQDEKSAPKSFRPAYHLHGHPRSGCASRPEVAPFLEKGFSVTPYF
jgi:hypothetical protein